jgi:formate dehydrogenase major subunit
MHAMQPRSNPPGAYPRLTQPSSATTAFFGPLPGTKHSIAPPRDSVKSLATHGRQTTGIFSCSKSTNEVNFLASKFARQVFGNNNIDSCNRT